MKKEQVLYIYKLIMVFSLISLSLFGIYFLYDRYLAPQSEVPTIYPETLITRIKPVDPGGMVLPNSSSMVYESLRTSKANKNIYIAPEPEQALSLTVNTDNIADQIDQILEKLNQDQGTSEQSSLEFLLPNEINPLAQCQGNEYPGQPGQTKQKNDEPSAEESTSLNLVKVRTKRGSLKASEISNNATKNTYKLQLASVKSEEAGRQKWESIRNKHIKFLRNTTFSIKKVKGIGEEFFYLVLAGDFTSMSAAKAVCNKLIHRQQPCIVTKG